MAYDAGFAVALAVREQVLSTLLLSAYASGDFARTLDTSALPGGGIFGGPPVANLNVFLSAPVINAHPDNTLTIAVELWGSLSVTMTTVQETKSIDGHLTATILPAFAVANSKLTLDGGASVLSVTEWDFALISTTGFSADADAYLRGPDFIARLQSLLQYGLSSGLFTLPSIDLSFLGSLADAVEMSAYSRIRQGVALIGLNISSNDLTLVGDAEQLTDFAQGYDAAAVVSAKAVPALLKDAQNAASLAAAQYGVTLQPLSATPVAGKILVSGSAGNALGSVDFSFSVVPQLFATKPGAYFQYLKKPLMVKARTWPAIAFTAQDMNVSGDIALWVDIVSAVFSPPLFGLLQLAAALLVSSIAPEITSQIESAVGGVAPMPRVQRKKVSDGATLRVEIADFEITSDGTYTGINVALQPLAAALNGPASIPANLRAQQLAYWVRLPFAVGSDDPMLRIRWTVTNPSNGAILQNLDGFAYGRERFNIVPDNLAPGLPRLRVSVRVYRALGAEITDLLNDAITLEMRGALPPAAYAHWYYDVKNPQVVFDADADSYAYTGDAVVRRHSRIHRTDRPCAMEPKHSRYVYTYNLLNDLPFPVVDIEKHRALLCDYCFYGGPTGQRPTL